MSEAKTILLVEDNVHLNEINRRALVREGYVVYTAQTLAQARAFLQAGVSPDAIILDIMLPDGCGVSFCSEIRMRTTAPILFLTSVSGYEQTLRGLAAGGDDYLNKPFDLNLLLAKVAAFLRRDELINRSRTGKVNILTLGALTLDIVAQQASLNGQDMALTPKEFSLLLKLINNRNQCVSPEALYESVWGNTMYGDANALKTTIWRLRKKLVSSNMEIVSVRGEGYVFECRDELLGGGE